MTCLEKSHSVEAGSRQASPLPRKVPECRTVQILRATLRIGSRASTEQLEEVLRWLGDSPLEAIFWRSRKMGPDRRGVFSNLYQNMKLIRFRDNLLQSTQRGHPSRCEEFQDDLKMSILNQYSEEAGSGREVQNSNSEIPTSEL